MSPDTLLFEEAERGPDEGLKLQFEAVSHLNPHEREAVQTKIAGVLHMYDSKRGQLSATAAGGGAGQDWQASVQAGSGAAVSTPT